MKNKALLAVGFAAALMLARPAAADTILFDTNGAAGGGTVLVDSFDWQQGNSMLIETSPTTGTVLFQSNLNGLVQGSSTVVFTQGGGGNYFSAVAAFDVTIGVGGLFTVNPGGTFRIYAIPANGDNLLGTGFVSGAATCGVGSSCILEASATASAGNFGIVAPIGVTVPLDSNGTDQYPGALTFRAVGSTHVDAVVTAVNPAYFYNLIIGTTLAINDTTNNLPFSAVDPSAAFSSNAIADGDRIGAGTPGGPYNPAMCGPLGCVNGNGTDILTQTDLTTTFVGAAPIVPEPATLTLFGLGLLGSAAARRRQLKKSK